MRFVVRSLPAESFTELASLSPSQLIDRGIEVYVADCKPGYPCRVGLRDAEPGERLFLLNYMHHDVNGPYRSSHAIFVREGADSASPTPGEVPLMLAGRHLSIRAFDHDGAMLAAEVTHGDRAAEVFTAMLSEQGVAYLHVHNANRGCYLARVDVLE